MSVIYDEQIGAQSTKLFGCSLKSINMQMGFDDQSTVITVVVIKESDQNFTLDSNDIQSVQHVQFGELDILGIVQAWENTNIDVAGTGIYTVKMTDCRMILDNAVIITNPATNWQTNNFGVNQLASGVIDSVIDYGENIITISIPTEHDFDYGLPFANVKESLDQATLYYGNEIFELNIDALEVLPYDDVGTGIPVRIDGPVKSISEVISEVCQQFGYQWWVECHRKSVIDQTIVIEVKIVSRVNEDDNPISLSLDALAELHPNQIIFRKDGHENTNEVTKNVLQGGVRRQLYQLSSDQIKPFWGWNQSGTVPLNNPAYQDPGYNIYRMRSTTTDQMKKALNGELDNVLGEVRLAALKGYANSHWGKTFYLQLANRYLDSDGIPWVKSATAGWWEENDTPDGLDTTALFVLSTDDGRWKSFLKLPRILNKWDDSVLGSNSVVRHMGHLYVLCNLSQRGKYVVMDLSVPAQFITNTPGKPKKIDCSLDIRNGWIPFVDNREFYGPWGSDKQTPSRFRQKGKTIIQIDSDLVPWKHGFRGISHEQGMRELNWIAEGRIKTGRIERQIINTGQLEVADIPKVNIGQIIIGGSNITNINTQFNANRITTRYSMNLYTDELGNFKQIERKKINEYFKLLRKTQETYKKDISINEEIKTLSGPAQKDITYTWEWPTGGLGFTASIGSFGGYYAIRRANIGDIDPQSFIAGVASTYAEWSHVRNLAEPVDSPGYLPIGTKVTVNFFRETEEGPQIPYIEQTPPNFSAIVEITGKSIDGPYYDVAGAGLSYTSVPNLGESSDSPGYLSLGLKVIVNVVWEEGVYYPKIEVTPPTFAPPIP
jgi:hypothetical protein